jgi:ACS family hexuronate transporter-like MFS transporter
MSTVQTPRIDPEVLPLDDESGLRMTQFRWVVLALIFFGTTINYIDRLVIAILAPDLQRQYAISDVAYGYIGAAFGLAYALGQLISGGLLDRLGTRLGYALALTGWSICAMLTGLGRSALSFGVFRAMLGFSESPAFPAAAKTCAEWFPKRQRAFAFGFVNAGSNMAAILAPIVVPWLTIRSGWQSAFIVTGALGLVLLAFWLPLYRRPEEHPRISPGELAFIRSDPPDASTQRVPGILDIPWLDWRGRVDRDSFIGIITCLCLLLIGIGPQVRLVVNLTRQTSVAWIGISVAVFSSLLLLLILTIAMIRRRNDIQFIAEGSADPNKYGCLPTRNLVGYRQAWVFALGKFITDPMWWFYMTWLPKFLHDRYDLNLSQLGLPLVTIYVLADLGSLGGGWLSSFMIKHGSSTNLGRKTALLASASLALPIAFAQNVSNLWLAVLFLGLATAAHQGFSSNLYTLCSDLFPKRAVGSVAGLGGTFGWIGASLFQAFTGSWVQHTHNYSGPFVCAGLAYLVAFAVIHGLSPRLHPAKNDEVIV